MRVYRLIILAFLFSTFSCNEKVNEPLVVGSVVPQTVKNIKVENMPGAAKVSYTLPSDHGLLYVSAEYINDKGKKIVVNSSAFKNYIMLEGFGMEKSYEIELFSISKSEDRSLPTKVIINPTTPPVQITAQTLEVFRTFGGVALNFKNKFKTEFVLYTLIKDEDGKWIEYDRYYSGAEHNDYAVRKLAPHPTDFAFYLKDKWQNHSDTLYQTITPLYEEELDKSFWKDAALLDDFNDRLYPNNPLSYLWTPGGKSYFFQDHKNYPEKAVMPNWITIDFGKRYILGRMKMHMVQHSASWKFGSCSPRRFEIWASNEPSVDWNRWTLLGDFESIRPSGRPVGQPLTDDDERQILEGEDFSFELMEESYRYIRYKVKETWGRSNYMCLLELTFWGQADGQN